MASSILYPPIVNSQTPSFIAGTDSFCKIPFTLSQFNSANDFEVAHVTVVKQDNGLNMIKDDYGILLDVAIEGKETENPYIEIPASALKNGWVAGWIYKIQIRLSTITFGSEDSANKAAWLTQNASSFTEWSAITVVKPIKAPSVNIKINGLSVYGTYECDGEPLYSYSVWTDYENSGTIIAEKENGIQHIKYELTKDYELDTVHNVYVSYSTINGYQPETLTGVFEIESGENSTDIVPVVYEDDKESMQLITTPIKEEDRGCILIKLYSESDSNYQGKICLRRADSKSNFKTWTDIKIINVDNNVNLLPPIEDFTIESGVFYQYAIQTINGESRSIMNKSESKIIRNFEYSFLVGENNKQLKLTFNNEIGNFRINIGESKADAVGSKYAVYQRNGDTYYKTFSMNGLISFQGDESNTFYSREEAFGENKDLYDDYNKKNEITIYDVIYERYFRDAVMEFLYDGKPKLFKSPTEGNLLVRLMNVSFTPNKSLNRMIYNFSAEVNEYDDATMKNYIKYNLVDIGE